MMTMRTILNRMVPAAVCLLALAGCTREKVLEESEVRFTVSSDNASTRTSFSGEMVTVGSELHERVDWVAGDRITIWSDKAEKLDESHSSVYAVTDVHVKEGSSNLISRASIENANSGGGLRWKDGGETHKFFAVYGADAVISSVGGVQTVTGGHIPANPTSPAADMDYAYMVGVLESAYASTVTLPFRQMYTAFEITVENKGSADVPISSFGLSSTSTKLAGAFSVAYASSLSNLVVTPAEDAVNAITLTPSSAVSVPAGGSVKFTILALGLTQRNLSITLTGTTFGTRTLALKNAADSWVDFNGPSMKHRITVSLPELLDATGGELTWKQTAIGEDITWDALSAVIEAPAYTRTEYDKTTGDFEWTLGDEIALFLKKGEESIYKTEVTKVTPGDPASTGTFPYTPYDSYSRVGYAVYPASSNPTYTGGDLGITLPASYDLTKTTSVPLPMVAVNAGSTLTFRPVAGLLRILCENIPTGVTTLTVTVAGENSITGAFTVTNPGTTTPQINATTGTAKTVTFTVSGGSATLNLPLPCGAYTKVTVVAGTKSAEAEFNFTAERGIGKKLHFDSWNE